MISEVLVSEVTIAAMTKKKKILVLSTETRTQVLCYELQSIN